MKLLILLGVSLIISCGGSQLGEGNQLKVISDWQLTQTDMDIINFVIDDEIECANSLIPEAMVNRNFPLIIRLKEDIGIVNAGFTKLDSDGNVVITIDRFPQASQFESLLRHEFDHALWITFGYGRALDHSTNDFKGCCDESKGSCESFIPFGAILH